MESHSSAPLSHSVQAATAQNGDSDSNSNQFYGSHMLGSNAANNYPAHYLLHKSSNGINFNGLSNQAHGGQADQSLHSESSFDMAHMNNHVDSADVSSPNDLMGPSSPPFINPNASMQTVNHDSENMVPFRFNQQDYGAVAVDPNLLNFADNGLQVMPDGTSASDFNNNMLSLSANSPSNGQQSMPTISRHQSASPNPTVASGFGNPAFSMNSFPRSREASTSLDPASAMFPGNEWGQLNAYRGHQRTASDNISEFSSHSNQASPYLGHLDSFDTSQASPLLGAASDPSFNNDLGLQQFNLNDGHHTPGHSPGHSPHISPQQQSLPMFPSTDGMFAVQNSAMNEQISQHNDGREMFPNISPDAFPMFNQHSPGDFGAADHMSPPEINIDYAPTSRIAVEHNRVPTMADDTLSPPPYLGRGRERAKSDSFAAASRSSTPGLPSRGRFSSLQSEDSHNKLSPFPSQSRSPSPGRGRAGSVGNRARSSSAASDHRDYILDLANPERSPSNGGDSKRIQKHPATFQCTLCPKRFTRAYNLRSHLRTHTDERPFVCTVCGKAFARQHDRKRHEGLHSGEKKFVCRGLLQNQSSWGCGRRFARADALGRHFRSEAGRVCIKPLLDEEVAEKRKQMAEEHQQQLNTPGITLQQPMMDSGALIDVMSNFLPAAILLQYPALANIDWNAMQSVPHAEDDYSARNSFDASSGGDYELSENEASDYAETNQMNMMGGMNMNANGLDPQQHLRQHTDLRGHRDYVGDFDGR